MRGYKTEVVSLTQEGTYETEVIVDSIAEAEEWTLKHYNKDKNYFLHFIRPLEVEETTVRRLK